MQRALVSCPCARLLTWPTLLQLHTYLAQNVLRKPLVIEEFGLTWFKKTPAQQRVLFQVGDNDASETTVYKSGMHAC